MLSMQNFLQLKVTTTIISPDTSNLILFLLHNQTHFGSWMLESLISLVIPLFSPILTFHTLSRLLHLVMDEKETLKELEKSTFIFYLYPMSYTYMPSYPFNLNSILQLTHTLNFFLTLLLILVIQDQHTMETIGMGYESCGL